MWNRSAIQVQCMRQGAQGWWTGMTLRDGMGKEVGWRVRMGNTCTPMADTCECMAKTTTICKVIQFSSVQSLSHVLLFATPWISARQASLSITNSRSSLKLTSIESVMPSSHLILCRPFLFLPPIPPSLFQWVNSSHEVAKVLEFQL